MDLPTEPLSLSVIETDKNLYDLSDELLLQIFSCAGPKGRRNLSLVCQRFYNIARDKKLLQWEATHSLQKLLECDIDFRCGYFPVTSVKMNPTKLGLHVLPEKRLFESHNAKYVKKVRIKNNCNIMAPLKLAQILSHFPAASTVELDGISMKTNPWEIPMDWGPVKLWEYWSTISQEDLELNLRNITTMSFSGIHGYDDFWLPAQHLMNSAKNLKTVKLLLPVSSLENVLVDEFLRIPKTIEIPTLHFYELDLVFNITQKSSLQFAFDHLFVNSDWMAESKTGDLQRLSKLVVKDLHWIHYGSGQIKLGTLLTLMPEVETVTFDGRFYLDVEQPNCLAYWTADLTTTKNTFKCVKHITINILPVKDNESRWSRICKHISTLLELTTNIRSVSVTTDLMYVLLKTRPTIFEYLQPVRLKYYNSFESKKLFSLNGLPMLSIEYFSMFPCRDEDKRYLDYVLEHVQDISNLALTDLYPIDASVLNHFVRISRNFRMEEVRYGIKNPKPEMIDAVTYKGP